MGINVGDVLGGLFGAGANYYAGEEGIKAAEEAGAAGLATGKQVGQEAADMAAFKGYTVKSGLGTGTVDDTGATSFVLTPEEQARQNQYLGQAQGMFGRVGEDTERATTDLYNQIRAAQAPEEERERIRMNAMLQASGRGGITSSQYGGTSEQFAYEKARQEAMLNAQLGARNQVGQEQQRLLTGAQGLQNAGYAPNNQMLSMFGAGATPASLADAARRTQGDLYGTSSGRGLESYMEGQKQANELRQIQLQGLTGTLGGYVNPETGKREDGLFDILFG